MTRDVPSQFSRLVVLDEFCQGGLVQRGENMSQRVGILEARRKAGAVVLAQGSDMGVAMLAGDLAILIAMTVVEGWLFHCIPPNWFDLL